MFKPIVAIVGRPNVGKSTFFNKLVGRKISIVDDTPGVTRDRIYAGANWCGKDFIVVDTGGLDSRSDDKFQADIKAQAQIAINDAHVIVFLVDGRTGITATDEEVASMLKRSKAPVVLVVNKLDNFEVENTYEFYNLGLGQPFPISCIQAKGIGDVLDEIVNHFPPETEGEEDSKITKIAIVGRPNVGKSSIVNRLIGEDRVLVSDIEGTTRDSVNVPFKYNKKEYQLVDTAGLRRKRSYENQSIEGYSVLRTMSSINDADVVMIVVSGNEDKLTEQDVRIAGYVHEVGKPSVIVVNKWDEKTMDKGDYDKMLAADLAFMSYYKSIYISALTGSGIGQLVQLAEDSFQNASKRITTGLLNDILHDAVLNFAPHSRSGKHAKINYITQASTCPPTFIIFMNDSKLINFSYERYLENRLRQSVDFSGTPMKLIFRSKEDKI